MAGVAEGVWARRLIARECLALNATIRPRFKRRDGLPQEQPPPGRDGTELQRRKP